MEHKTKYKQLTEAYLHALGVITESTATWAEFLCSAAYTYEERFQSQVLLHHQRPGIKAVATLNQWDREKNRHIVRGTHGIPVFDAKHPECLTYVFDYQDTAGRSTPGLLPWTVYENKSGITRHNLLRRSGEKSLDSYVHTKVQQIVDTEVKSETSAAMRTELQKFLEQSAKYVVYTRLNMPVDNLDTSAFSFATQYQNRPKVLERLGTLLSHSLVACLSPVRDIAQAMHMTMPPPEGLAVQKKDTRTRSVPETSEVTAEASPEAPREWGFYVIPDLKTWATNSSGRTPIEHYETFEEARDRFAALRDQPYNKTNDLNDDGQPYAHLTLGLESKDKLSSVDILQVRAGQNYLVEDFTRMERLRADSVVLENLSRVAREIGFDRVRPYVMENGSYKALPDISFTEWENPYFSVTPPSVSDKNHTGKRASRRVEKQKVDFEQLSLTSAAAEVVKPNVEDFSFEYQLLDRLKTDCEYFLGEGHRSEKHLWAGNVREHILKMRELYSNLLIKPVWLTESNIDSYAQRMAAPYQVVVYHNLENGFDERMEFQTLEQAEQAAQKFVNGSMEGENGFAYDGAGVYDLSNEQWLRVYGHFPDEHAMEKTRNRPTSLPAAQTHAVEIPVAGEWKKFPTVKEAEQAAFEEYKAGIARDAKNFTALDEQGAPGGAKARFQDNINALRLLQHLEATGMQATPEQQQLLARYVGWGGLADAFDARKDNWHKEYQELKELLPEAEYEAARASTLTSYYTSPEIVRAMYSTLERFGLQGGNILEPSMGVGAFFANRPASFDESAHLFGVEIDPVTGRIAKQLYPKANIQICGYEKATLPDSYFDVVIGNVPFGQYKVNDPAFNRYNFLIHDYFAAKSIDKLRVGGIQAIITTSGTMDKQTEDVRKYLAARCELIGAVRLPNTAFKALAGTEVTADILFLQKRDHIVDQDVSWVHTGTNADGIPMNQYFIDHPEMICGKMEMVSGPYGMRPTCQPDTSTSLEQQLQAAMGRLNATLVKAEPVILEQQPGEATTLPADPDVRNYSYCIRDGKIFFRTDSVMQEVTANATAQARIKGMISILATTRELIQAQLDDFPDEAVEQLQRRLNHEYDTYTEKYGRLSSRANSLAFRDDSGYSLLCSLENFDDDHNFKSKSDMFTKKTIRPNRVIEHVETASEALALSVQEHTSVDLLYMEQLTGKTRDELLQDLTGVVFRVPGETTAAGEPLYQTGEEYLSGDVRKKLATAEIFAKQDPSYQVNVDSLKNVQPKDLTASEIELHLGTTWIPPEDIKQFILDTMEPNRWVAQSIKVSYNRLNATWNIEGSSVDSYSLKATTTFGTKRKNFYEILRCSLNLQTVKVVDYIEDVDGKKKAVPNVKETRLAQDKQQQIEAAFKDWIYRDPDRRRRLVDYYNTHYNNLRPREYDGSFLRFPGMNPEISLRPHQRNVVARILFGGNTLVAHSVGAGKTMVMGAAAMEKKRLGLCNKTLIIVPNHLTEQMGSELLSLYPNANILVSTRHDFEKNRRKLFCSRIATGNYDIVIMGHSQFSRIPLSSERQQKFLQDEIERYTQEIASAKKEKSGQDLSVKQMEATKKRLQSHLEELMDSPKDDVVTFEQLGVDSLMVDEAHEFKNLAVTTKMQNVAGISTSESQKATDLLMKTQYLDEITGGRGLVFCTGTPISNSPVELYTMMRYLQASTLRAHDLLSFDAWAANFGQTTTSIELAPEGTGYRSKTRFSRFFNLPELISMWKLATDVQTSDMLNLQVPDLEGGKATAVMCPPTELQKESIQALGERAEKVRAGNVDPHTDNMLKITTDGRKLALDQRLLNPLLPDVPENKATACASKVFEIWQNTMATQSTQLIFSDLATPSTGEWNVYDDIRDKLIAKGIPKEQIAFIHDANTDAKKATLFAKVRAGKVRILMGSTQKMGAGTNVQTKLIALHHLDVPWRPSDIEQREGRILRQGNENPSVQIYRYATEGSFDAYSWQLIENKQKFISQIMTSKSPARSCQDLDEVALSYAEIKALCAGNPLIKEKMELDNEVARLSTLRSSHMSQIFELQDKIAIGYPTSIQKVEESLKAISGDMETYKANSRFNPDGSEKFSAIVMGTAYTERKAADAALRDALQGATAGDVIIGQYRGFDIHAYYNAKAVSFMGYLQGEQKYNFEFNPKENFSSFRHLLDKLSDTQALDQERLTILNKNLEDAKKAVNQPFAYEEDFQTKLARLNELNQLLSEDDKTTQKKENPMQKEEHQNLDEFLDDGKIVPANQLPAGWQWEMYNDGSGSLHGPNSERYYSYDLAPYATSGLIEYNATGKGYDTFEGSLDDFRNWAEQQVQAQLEVQKYRTQLNQTYDSMANDPQKYLDYLTFRSQCVGLGAENSVAVFAQNPKATYCPAPEALGSPNVKSGEEDHFVSVLRSDGIERVYALEQYDLPESEYLDNAPLQWTDAQHGDLMHRVEDAAHLANISIVKDIRHGSGFFDAPRNTIHIREGENDTEQLKSLLEGYSEAVIARTNTAEKPVAELESASLTALLQVRCGVPVNGQLKERIITALEDARQVSGFSMKDSVARLHNAMEYCVRYAELEQTSEQYQAQQIEPEAMTPQSEAFMEMM